MKQYRNKPVVIEAIRFIDDVDRILEIQKFAGQETIRVDYKDKNNPTLKIDTLEGVMTASVGDYIIKGVQGEFYPCKPDIFEKTYEEAQPKQSIINRATSYAYMVAGESPDIVLADESPGIIVLAGEAYQRGAEDEHRLLTEWHDAREQPDKDGTYLLKCPSKDGFFYSVGKYCYESDVWDCGIYHWHRETSKLRFKYWRPIHE